MADTFEIDGMDAAETSAASTALTKGFEDPRGEFPRPEQWYKPSDSNAKASVKIGGGDPNIDVAKYIEENITDSTYGDVSTKRTKAGHILQFDDTGNGERIVLMHANGTGIEMMADGTMKMRTEQNMITSVAGTSVLIVEGDLQISAGNVTVDATGDLDMNVSGDYNLTVGGNKREEIIGSNREKISGNQGTVVTGNSSHTVVGTKTNSTLGDFNNIVKGGYANTVEGNYTLFGHDTATITSEVEIAISSYDIKMAATDVAIFAAGGTIGGTEMIYYGSNAIFSEGVKSAGVTATTGMTAPTFHGDLKGKASTAALADKATGASTAGAIGAAGTAGSITDTATTAADEASSAEPTFEIVDDYLENSNKGVRKVVIDKGDFIKDKIDLTAVTGGISSAPINIKDIRQILKDPANDNNAILQQYLIGNGLLSDEYFKKIPSGFNRSTNLATEFIPSSFAGDAGRNRTFLKQQRAKIQFKPDFKYDPMRNKVPDILGENYSGKKTLAITSKTLVCHGTPISKFCVRHTLNHISEEDRFEVARNLLMQSEVIKLKRNAEEFEKYRLVVAEGIYKKGPNEKLTIGSTLDLAQKGRAIVYELYDDKNVNYPEVAYDFAEYLMRHLFAYEKIILNYDTIAPTGARAYQKQHVQIIVVMPEVDEDYKGIGNRDQIQTLFNNKVLSRTDLVEVGVNAPGELVNVPIGDSPVVRYLFGAHTIRDKKLVSRFENALADAAVSVGIETVNITSGKQPGTRGLRVKNSSTRHDTGLAADLTLSFRGKLLNFKEVEGTSYKLDQAKATEFIKAAIARGILGGGSGVGYMGANVMHLDMIGSKTGEKIVWNSDEWFSSAFGITSA
tara:strand:- start:1461 stop:4010 length:2550 start_codon:yes stop_codon:yes gene_type:complete